MPPRKCADARRPGAAADAADGGGGAAGGSRDAAGGDAPPPRAGARTRATAAQQRPQPATAPHAAEAAPWSPAQYLWNASELVRADRAPAATASAPWYIPLTHVPRDRGVDLRFRPQVAAQQGSAAATAPLQPRLAPARISLPEGAAAGGDEAGAAASSSPYRSGGQGSRAVTCKVPGCAQKVSIGTSAHTRYRVCGLHLRALSVDMGGGGADNEAQRFCQKCCKFEPVSAFAGEFRTCRARLEASKAARASERRRAAAGSAAAASAAAAPAAAPKPPPRAAAAGAAEPAVAELDRWLGGAGGEQLEALLGDAPAAWQSAFMDAVAPPPQQAPPEQAPAQHQMAPEAAEPAGGGAPQGPAPPMRVTFTLKMHGTTPAELPPGLAADVGRWLTPHFGAPPLLSGSVEPGCTLLTVDAAVAAPRAAPPGAAAAPPDARALAACLRGGADATFWAGCHASLAVGQGPTLHMTPGEASLNQRPPASAMPIVPLPPLQPAAAVCGRRRCVELRSAGPMPRSGPLRCRLNGQLLAPPPRAVAGATLRLRLPADASDGVALLDWAFPPEGSEAESEGDGGAFCSCEPRAVLLTRHADVAAELSAALADAGGAGRDALLFGLAAALRPSAPRALVAAAAAAALRRRLHATAARLLAALPHAADAEADGDAGANGADVACGSLLHAAARSGSARAVAAVLEASAAAAAATSSSAPGGVSLLLLLLLPGGTRLADTSPQTFVSLGGTPQTFACHSSARYFCS